VFCFDKDSGLFPCHPKEIAPILGCSYSPTGTRLVEGYPFGIISSRSRADGVKGGQRSPLALEKRERDAERSGHVLLQPYGDGSCRKTPKNQGNKAES